MKLSESQIWRLGEGIYLARRREALLRELVTVLDTAIDGLPDHPWIPGASIGPVVAKLAEIRAAAVT